MRPEADGPPTMPDLDYDATTLVLVDIQNDFCAGGPLAVPDALLRAAGAARIMPAGLATDVCVLHTALDARRLGYGVTIVEAACRGIDVAGSLPAAWARLKDAGVRRLECLA